MSGTLRFPLALWLANLEIVPEAAGSALGLLRFYANLVLVAGLVALLSTPGASFEGWRARDARLGDLCYPIDRNPMQVGFAISSLGVTPPLPSRRLFWLSLAPVLLPAAALLRWVSDPIEGLRDRVKAARPARPDETSGGGPCRPSD